LRQGKNPGGKKASTENILPGEGLGGGIGGGTSQGMNQTKPFKNHEAGGGREPAQLVGRKTQDWGFFLNVREVSGLGKGGEGEFEKKTSKLLEKNEGHPGAVYQGSGGNKKEITTNFGQHWERA